MNNHKQENVISMDGQGRHNIKRYEFRALETLPSPVESKENPLEPKTEEPPLEPIASSPQPPAPSIPPLDPELFEKILARSDGLAEVLLALQAQLEKQEREIDSIVREAREESRALGIKEGQEQARAELTEEVEAQKRAFVESIELLERSSKEMSGHIDALERDLSAIAVDIAKEVIVKEVSEHSAEVAYSLAKELLDSLKDATKVLLKLNPEDYALIIKDFEGEDRIKIQPDKAIAKGGVVIMSDDGNLDGTIMSRFQTLKRTILENLAERN